jgi:outer membrane protein insertion porin family
MKKKILSGLLVSLFALPAMAFEPFVVKDIRVEGIQRTEAGTVFNYLPVKVGDTLDNEKASEAIRALFATGFFKDVRIEAEGSVMVVLVEERPAIAQIDFTGMKEFDKEALKKGLRELGLAESRILDRALLDKAEQELKRQYLARGKYGVDVTTTVTPLERNRVAINFAIDEGEVAKIKQINIVGASAFKEKDLLKLFTLSTPGWLTWYTKNDQYSKQKLQGDLETLRSHYLDQGYLEFNIESTQVQITPDKRDIYITVNVSEGEKFTVSSVKVAGEMLIPEEEVRKLVTIKPGEEFSRRRVTETSKAISDRLANDGYAFANVNAAPEVDKEKRQVAFTFFIDPGRRVYVRRINVGGNTKTRDVVVRREVRQMEGAWYDNQKLTRSKQRIDRLGYFDEVTMETEAVPGTTDQVDANFTVKEKPTGSLTLGAGFSSSEKLVLSGSVSQQNLFGSGKSLSVQINTGKINTVYALSYTDPYYTVDGVSRGWDVYVRDVDPTSLSVGRYKSSSVGGGLRFGVPIAEDDSISFGLSLDHTRIETDEDSPQRYQDYVDVFGNTANTVLATVGWARDRRDSAIYPTKGALQRANGEVTVPLGNMRYWRASYQHQRFFPLGRTFTLMLNGEVGVGDGFGEKPLPFFKNYFAGGISSVRGFDYGSIGPRDAVTDEFIGGSRKVVGNVELLFPLPGSGADKSLRLSTFVDGGIVWGNGERFKAQDIRYSLGFGLAWSSPLGPLKFSVATPLKKKEDDKLQRFQFQLGTLF